MASDAENMEQMGKHLDKMGEIAQAIQEGVTAFHAQVDSRPKNFDDEELSGEEGIAYTVYLTVQRELLDLMAATLEKAVDTLLDSAQQHAAQVMGKQIGDEAEQFLKELGDK